MLLPRTPLADAVSVAQRVREGATECVLPGKDAAAAVTLSVGIAELSEDDDVIRLLQRTEAAMAAAGKNRICRHTGQRPELVQPAARPQASDPAAKTATTGVAGAVPSRVVQTLNRQHEP